VPFLVNFECQCDACGESLPVASHLFYHHKFLEKAKYEAVRAGWMVSKTTVLCPKHKAVFERIQPKGDLE